MVITMMRLTVGGIAHIMMDIIVAGAVEIVIRKAQAARGAVVALAAVGLAAAFDIVLRLFGKFWLGICLCWDICRTFGLRLY